MYIHSMMGRGDNHRAHPHWVQRPNGADVHLLEYTVSGRGLYRSGSSSFHAPAGHLVVFKPNVPQDYGMDPETGAWDHIWLTFQPRASWYEWMHWPEEFPGVLHLALPQPLRRHVLNRLKEMHAILRGPMPRRLDFLMNGLEELLLRCDTINPESAHSRLDPRIHAALEYLCSKSQGRVTIADLSAHCHISASRLAHLFRQQVGQTPMQYLERHRMERASGLLLMTTRSIGEIAYEVGFQNPLYFSRVFRRHQHLSPREFRNRSR